MTATATFDGETEEIAALREAAAAYFDDDRWAINAKLWTDGTISAYAYQSHGRTDEGHLVQERLFATDDGIRAERVELQRREVDSEGLGCVGDANK